MVLSCPCLPCCLPPDSASFVFIATLPELFQGFYGYLLNGLNDYFIL